MLVQGTIRRLTVCGATMLAASLVLAGCSSTPTGPAAAPETSSTLAPVKGGRLVFGLTGETDGWLPQAARWSPSSDNVAKAVFDPLVALGADESVQPYLAESFTPAAGFDSWEIKVRPKVTFHDGTAFDAAALVQNLEADRTSPLVGSAFKPITAVDKVDDVTVRVKMSSPWANFPSLFLTQAGFMVAPAQLAAQDTRKPIGTGPFVFDSWTPDSSFKAKRNPNYWQAGLPYLDAVEFRPLTDVDNRRKSLAAGDIDVYHTNAPADLLRSIKKNDLPPDSTALADESEGDQAMMVLNTQSGLFQDKDLRVALAQATDRKGLVDQLWEGFFDVADQPFSKASAWHAQVDFPTFDLAAAKAKVDTWKAAHGGQAPTFTLSLVANTDEQQVSQVLQQMWGAAGFEVVLQGVEETKFVATLIGGNFEAASLKFFNAPDPDGDYPFWSGTTLGQKGEISLNLARYTSTAAQAGLDAGHASADPAARAAAYAGVWQDFAQNVPYLWLYDSKFALVHNNRVHGLDESVAPDGTKLKPVVWGSVFLTRTWIAI